MGKGKGRFHIQYVTVFEGENREGLISPLAGLPKQRQSARPLFFHRLDIQQRNSRGIGSQGVRLAR